MQEVAVCGGADEIVTVFMGARMRVTVPIVKGLSASTIRSCVQRRYSIPATAQTSMPNSADNHTDNMPAQNMSTLPTVTSKCRETGHATSTVPPE